MTVKFFGPRAWGLAIEEPRLMVEPPAGVTCERCGEGFAPSDYGTIIPFIEASGSARPAYEHRECTLRGIVGSVGHQLRECGCFGGTYDDPPGLTKREAARAAVELYESNQHAIGLHREGWSRWRFAGQSANDAGLSGHPQDIIRRYAPAARNYEPVPIGDCWLFDSPDFEVPAHLQRVFQKIGPA